MLLSAVMFGRIVAVTTAGVAFLAYNFFFLDPLLDFHVAHMVDLVTLIVFLLVAIVTGSLAGTVREQAEAAQARMKSTRALYDFSRRLGATVRLDDMLHAVTIHANRVSDRQVVVMLAEGDDLQISHAWPPEDTLDPSAWAAARWAREHTEPAGLGTDTLPTSDWHFRPIRTKESTVGVVGVRRKEEEHALAVERLRTLDAVLDQAAVAIERIAYAAEAAQVEALHATDRLRGALLSSISRSPNASHFDPGFGHGSKTSKQQPERGGTRRIAGNHRGRSGAPRSLRRRSPQHDQAGIRRPSDAIRLDRRARADRFGGQADQPPADLVRRPAFNDAPLIKADFVLLENVLVNLIDNALKHARGRR